MWRVTARFDCEGLEGRRHTIVEMRRGDEIDFILEDGHSVTRLGDGTFEIDGTGEILRRCDAY